MFKKKLFNKKVGGYQAGKKLVISHFCLICFFLIFGIFIGIRNAGSDVGYYHGYEVCQSTFDFYLETNNLSQLKVLFSDNPFSDSIDIGTNVFLIAIFVVVVLIIRLIYELIIIPIAIDSKQKQIYQQNIYAQQVNQSPLNTPYTQQPIQPEQVSTAPETQFKFCSQCGTRYDAAKNNCPNCGMK